ncbi:MAG: hypothetical protein ACXW3C_16690 [Pyrinomonadaceae bacterium]
MLIEIEVVARNTRVYQIEIGAQDARVPRDAIRIDLKILAREAAFMRHRSCTTIYGAHRA